MILRTAITAIALFSLSPVSAQHSLIGPDGKADHTITLLPSTEPTSGSILQIDSDFPVSDTLAQSATAIHEKAFALGFRGQVVISLGRLSLMVAVDDDLVKAGHHPSRGEQLMWPLASVTKQQLAWKLVQWLDIAGLGVDEPVSTFIPRLARTMPDLTLRQLLQHRSGLRNPEDTPKGADGFPQFYTATEGYGLDWCLEQRGKPPEQGFKYNNCDYIVLGAVFDELAYAPFEEMLVQGPVLSCPDGEECREEVTYALISPETASMFYAMRSPERDALPGYGAAGALGTLLTNVAFDNDEMMSRYPAASGAEKAFWQGDPALGYMALGHWVFPMEIDGCDGPVLISQRKGEIGQYRIENIMLPEMRRSMVFATIEPAFEFGEIWAKEGFLYNAVSLLACGDAE